MQTWIYPFEYHPTSTYELHVLFDKGGIVLLVGELLLFKHINVDSKLKLLIIVPISFTVPYLIIIMAAQVVTIWEIIKLSIDYIYGSFSLTCENKLNNGLRHIPTVLVMIYGVHAQVNYIYRDQ